MDTYTALTTAITSSAPAIVNEFCELLRLEVPVYDVTELHQRGIGSEFSASVRVTLGNGSCVSASGMASTKRHAKACAALNLLVSLPRVPPLHEDSSSTHITELLTTSQSASTDAAPRPASYAAAVLNAPAASAGSKRDRSAAQSARTAPLHVDTRSGSASSASSGGGDGIPPSPAHKKPQKRMTPRSAAFVQQAAVPAVAGGEQAEGVTAGDVETSSRPAGATPEMLPPHVVPLPGRTVVMGGARDTRAVDFTNVDGNARKLAAMQAGGVHALYEVVKQVWAPTPLFMRNAFRWAATFTNEMHAIAAGRDTAVVPLAAVAAEPSVNAGVTVASDEGVAVRADVAVDAPAANPAADAAAPQPAPLAVHLRIAVSSDVSCIMGLIRELAEFEREPDAVKTSEESMLRDGFGATPMFHVLLAEVDDTVDAAGEARKLVVAMAFCYVGYSTWEGRMLYLEDLYVKPAYRRHGISKIMFTALARAAKVAKCARMQWSALDWNTPAISGYTHPRIGATLLKEWQLFRLYADGIARVAQLPVVA